MQQELSDPEIGQRWRMKTPTNQDTTVIVEITDHRYLSGTGENVWSVRSASGWTAMGVGFGRDWFIKQIVEETKVSEMTDDEIANLRTGIDRALNIEGYDDAERVKQIEEIAKQNARFYQALSKTEREKANAEEVIFRVVMAHLSTADDDSGLLLRLERGVERLASENARLRAKQEETN